MRNRKPKIYYNGSKWTVKRFQPTGHLAMSTEERHRWHEAAKHAERLNDERTK